MNIFRMLYTFINTKNNTVVIGKPNFSTYVYSELEGLDKQFVEKYVNIK